MLTSTDEACVRATMACVVAGEPSGNAGLATVAANSVAQAETA